MYTPTHIFKVTSDCILAHYIMFIIKVMIINIFLHYDYNKCYCDYELLILYISFPLLLYSFSIIHIFKNLNKHFHYFLFFI